MAEISHNHQIDKKLANSLLAFFRLTKATNFYDEDHEYFLSNLTKH
jgi:hypothetical protein